LKTLPSLEHFDWLLSFDFDGTLANPDQEPPVVPEFFETIKEMRKSHRAYWGINTGRTLMFALEGMADARFPFLPDFIIEREREIYIPNEQGLWVPAEDWNRQCVLAHEALFRRVSKFLEEMQGWVERETAAVWGMQESEPAGIVASTVAEMDLIVRRIDQELSRYPDLSYQRNGIYLRFSHRDYHKGTAMAEVARLIGVDVDHTFTIGDSHNDLDMLNPKFAGKLACPGNACDEVKTCVRERGGFVAKSPASRGTVEALKNIFSL